MLPKHSLCVSWQMRGQADTLGFVFSTFSSVLRLHSKNQELMCTTNLGLKLARLHGRVGHLNAVGGGSVGVAVALAVGLVHEAKSGGKDLEPAQVWHQPPHRIPETSLILRLSQEVHNLSISQKKAKYILLTLETAFPITCTMIGFLRMWKAAQLDRFEQLL